MARVMNITPLIIRNCTVHIQCAAVSLVKRRKSVQSIEITATRCPNFTSKLADSVHSSQLGFLSNCFSHRILNNDVTYEAKSWRFAIQQEALVPFVHFRLDIFSSLVKTWLNMCASRRSIRKGVPSATCFAYCEAVSSDSRLIIFILI